VSDEPSGTSAKFNCVLDGGEIVKVKYGRNPEIYAETAATELLALLGYPADEVRLVRLVRCYGCPRFPFLATQMLSAARMPTLLGPYGHDAGYTDFEWPAVEHRFDGSNSSTPTRSGAISMPFAWPPSSWPTGTTSQRISDSYASMICPRSRTSPVTRPYS
jgi:hypothetical protein